MWYTVANDIIDQLIDAPISINRRLYIHYIVSVESKIPDTAGGCWTAGNDADKKSLAE